MQKLAWYRGSRVSINWGNARRGRRAAVSFSALPRQGLINTKAALRCHSPARPHRKASMGISVPVALGGRGTGTQQSSCFLLGLRELTNGLSHDGHTCLGPIYALGKLTLQKVMSLSAISKYLKAA